MEAVERVIAAFENGRNCTRIKEILESSGTACCILCRTAAEVRRAAGKLRVAAVVCGYKFPDATAEELYEDLPDGCAMLVIAPQSMLDLVGEEGICKLPAPVTRGDLTACVHALLQVGRRPERSGAEQELISRAKTALMEREGLSEEQAHRFLQRSSMNTGVPLARAARAVLERQGGG